MRVSEIFASVEGEGSRQGYLATFVRLHGCALRCSWCDSRYACEGTDYREMAPDLAEKSVFIILKHSSICHLPSLTFKISFTSSSIRSVHTA